MCGIAGILWRTAVDASTRALTQDAARGALAGSFESWVDRWLDKLDAGIAHRGPDGRGRFTASFVDGEHRYYVGLVHRRLAIIDAAGGHQPMLTKGREPREGTPQNAMVFNGCIDNHRELRGTLLSRGYAFSTHHSDTEVLAHALSEWGEDLCEKLGGMHAFASFDAASCDLLLSQDASLEKPLWWGRLRSACASTQQPGQPDMLAFASVPAALAMLQKAVEGRVQCAPASDLLHWLWLGASSRPLLSCAAPLKARGVVVSARAMLAEGDAAVSRAVAARPVLPQQRTDEPLTPQMVSQSIERAVTQRLESDVQVGCFLSGGVDSSLVTAFAARQVPHLQTFTVRMPDARYDESGFAAAAAAHLGTQHHELACAASPAEDIASLITSLGAPLADSSLLAAHWVARAARTHVKVCLSGDGGDELFAGYERHIAAMHLARAAPLLALLPSPEAALLHPKSRGSKLARLIAAARSDYLDARAIFSREQLARLVPLGAAHLHAVPLENAPPWHELDACTHDFEHALPDDLLLKVDHACMAVALESRAPLLARCVRDLALAAPQASLTSPSGTPSFWRELVPQRKALLRTVARAHLPAWIVDRPKMGFAVPVGAWLRGGGELANAPLRDLLHETIQNPDSLDPDVLGFEIDRKELRRIAAAHASGAEHHDQRLYSIIVLGVWCRWLSDLS